MRTFFLATALATLLASPAAFADETNYCKTVAERQFPHGVPPVTLQSYPVDAGSQAMILFLANDNPGQGWNITVAYPDAKQRNSMLLLARTDGAWIVFNAGNNTLQAQIYVNDSEGKGCYNLFPQPISALPLGVIGAPPPT